MFRQISTNLLDVLLFSHHFPHFSHEKIGSSPTASHHRAAGPGPAAPLGRRLGGLRGPRRAAEDEQRGQRGQRSVGGLGNRLKI